jgi:hypothetical protein
MEAFRQIKARCNFGVPFQQAFKTITRDWHEDDQLDFSYWIKFYEEKNHMKYKQAQYGYQGYFLPTRPTIPDPVPSPGAAIPVGNTADVNSAKDQVISEEERKKKIELHRKKIIGRLHSARKLLTDDNGKAVGGEHWEKLLDALNELEKQFHQVNKKTESSEIYQDMIIRRANILKRAGLVKSHDFLVKIAQGLPGHGDLSSDAYTSGTHGGELGNISPNFFADDMEDDDEDSDDVDDEDENDAAPIPQGSAAPAVPPAPQAAGAPNSAPAPTPPVGASPLAGDPNKGMKEFLDGLNGFGPDDDDDSAEDEEVQIDTAKADVLEVEDTMDIDDSHLGIDNHGYRVSQAQMAEPPLAKAPTNLGPKPPGLPKPLGEPKPVISGPKPMDKPVAKPGSDIEVSEKDTGPEHKDFDALIDAAFATLKVADIVRQLDDLSRIFKNREIARRLSIVDMMMDKLGLSSFFPSLAEATRSALESNQYCLTRIEEVRSRIGGALDGQGKSLHDMGQQHSINNQPKETELDAEENQPEGGELAGVKQHLGEQMKKDKLRKELRKNVEQTNLMNQVENKSKAPAEVEPIATELGPITKKQEKPIVPPTVTPGGPMSPAAK